MFSETVAGLYWQEIGSTNNGAMAKEMVDRIVMVREALAKVVGVAVQVTASEGLPSLRDAVQQG